MPLVLSLIGQRRGVSAAVEKKKKSVTYPTAATPQFVGGGFGGWYLPLSVSLSPSPTRLYPLKRQLESGSLTINGILEKRTVQG